MLAKLSNSKGRSAIKVQSIFMSLFYINHVSKITILYSYYLDQRIKIDRRMKNENSPTPVLL